MYKQASFSPKLMTRSLALELISRLKRLAAIMYSTSSWHSASIFLDSDSLRLGSWTNDPAARTWSLQMSMIRPLAWSISVSGVSGSSSELEP